MDLKGINFSNLNQHVMLLRVNISMQLVPVRTVLRICI